MKEPKKFIVGQKVSELPGNTMNALREGELRDRMRASRSGDDTRHFQPFSTAYVQLVWLGDDDLPPGSAVALGDVLNGFEDDPSAPFSSLKFKCNVPTQEDIDSGFAAITCVPIKQLPGDKYGCGFGYIPGACWAQVTINSADDTHADWVADSTTLESGTDGKFPIIAKPTGTGLKWCVVQLAGSGGGGATAAIAVIKGTVPASSAFDITGTLTDGGAVGTFGVLADSFTSTTITTGALIVEYDDTDDEALTVFKNGEPYVLPVINPSYMQFIPPSTGSPIMGTIATYGGTEYFVLPTMDPRSRPGWVAGNDQSIGHPADEMEQWEDDDLCA